MRRGFWNVQFGFKMTSGHVHDLGMKKLSFSEGGQFRRAKNSIGYRLHRIPETEVSR